MNSLSHRGDLTITVVYDNNPYQKGLEPAWGFACVIRGTEKTLLFDTGGDGATLLANMKKLRIEPEAIDLVVLSHQHWDHIGGFYHFLNKNSHVNLYLPHSFSAHFKDDLKRYGVEIVDVQEASKICKNVDSSGDLEGHIREQALLLHTARGTIIITGCAHPGIVNIIQKAKDMVQEEALLVMGGFHLGSESQNALGNIVVDFKRLGVQYVGPCHCSGDAAQRLFKTEYQNNFIPVGVGATITVKDLP